MSWESIKKYVGAATGSLIDVWRTDEAAKAGLKETEPPVGSKDVYRGTPGAVIGGISTTIILLLVAAWYFLKR